MHILVIEDQEEQRLLMREYLSLDAHDIETTASGAEGLSAFDSDRFDVVITDRAMPDISGEDVAARMKEKRPEIPIIMVTGYGEDSGGSGETRGNFDCVLSKPIDVKTLRTAISQVTENAKS